MNLVTLLKVSGHAGKIWGEWKKVQENEREKQRERVQDLHTHLLSSSNIRSPRQVQFTTPSGVKRQRSWHPPLFTLQGDDSPGSNKEKSLITNYLS